MGNDIDGAGTVAQLLEETIARRGLGPGSKLPTERELVTASGQSRSAVRNALATLESEGRIVRHVGRGTFLAPTPPEDHQEISPAESMAARLMIEPAIMPAIVTAARLDDFEEMERCLRGGERSEDFEAFEKWDAAFHRSLALATHNPLIVRISELVNSARLEPQWGQLKRKSFTAERRSEYVSDHRRIAEALIDRDSQRAQEAMRAHLLRVRTNLLGDGV